MTAHVERTRTALLTELVDDAGLFPPTALDMPDAVARHRRDQAERQTMLTHRFLCPASRLAELRTELVDGDHVRLGLITDGGAEGLDTALRTVEADPRLSLALLEMPLAKFDADTSAAVHAAVSAVESVPSDVPAHLEPVSADEVEALVAAVRDVKSRPMGAKIRCGGVRAELFPTPEQVAHFIDTCVSAGVPFKATAGLHRAVRHRAESTGFQHHGYLNLLLATAVATIGGNVSAIRHALELDDPTEVARGITELEPDTARKARAALVSYGSCSTSTPIEQAAQLLGQS